MKKFMNWLEKSFTPKMTKLLSKPWINAVSTAMQKAIPLILTGCSVYVYNVLKMMIPSLPSLVPVLQYSFGVLALFIAFLVGYELMEKHNHPNYMINCGITSVCVFMMIANPTGDNAGKLSTFLSHVGPAGMIASIVAASFVGFVFHSWSKVHLLENSSAPDFVVTWLNTIIPNLIVLIATMIIVNWMSFDIYAFVQGLFTPILNVSQSFGGFMLMNLVPSICYTLGISSWTFSGITTPIKLAGIQANIDAVAAGMKATNIVTNEAIFTLGFIAYGGMCATLPLNIMMLRSKSKQLKSLGKVFIIPSIFNVNEPLMYGAPVVLNPVLMLPAWICTLVGTVYVWVLMSTGLLNIPAKLYQIGQIPVPLSSWLATEDWRVFIWFPIIFVIYWFIWLPFFKTFENQKLAEEAAKAIKK